MNPLAALIKNNIFSWRRFFQSNLPLCIFEPNNNIFCTNFLLKHTNFSSYKPTLSRNHKICPNATERHHEMHLDDCKVFKLEVERAKIAQNPTLSGS